MAELLELPCMSEEVLELEGASSGDGEPMGWEEDIGMPTPISLVPASPPSEKDPPLLVLRYLMGKRVVIDCSTMSIIEPILPRQIEQYIRSSVQYDLEGLPTLNGSRILQTHTTFVFRNIAALPGNATATIK